MVVVIAALLLTAACTAAPPPDRALPGTVTADKSTCARPEDREDPRCMGRVGATAMTSWLTVRPIVNRVFVEMLGESSCALDEEATLREFSGAAMGMRLETSRSNPAGPAPGLRLRLRAPTFWRDAP